MNIASIGNIAALVGLDFPFVKNILFALLLGSLIGVERQWRQRRAGLRTNALVSVGSALFVLSTDAVGANGDHARIAAQVVSGIGFLGAGLIMRDGVSVRGLNTAATLWGTAAVGVLCGYGLNARAAFGASIILTANIVLRSIARTINQTPSLIVREHHYAIDVECRSADEERVRYMVLQSVAVGAFVLRKIQSSPTLIGEQIRITASIESPEKMDDLLEQIVSRLSVESGVNLASWTFHGSESTPVDD